MKRTYPAFALSLSLIYSSSLLAQNPAGLKLSGIVNVGQLKRAILERNDVSEPWRQFLLLGEGQREESVEVLSIQPDQAAVKLRLDGTNSVTLNLGGETNRLAGGIVLENAALEPVLRIYSQLANRTLLRAPAFRRVTFSLKAACAGPAAGAAALERALAEKEIATIPDGTKFVLVVPTAMAAQIKPRSAELKPAPEPGSGSNNGATEILPPGVINFPSTDIIQVMQIYSELVGRKLDRSEPFRTPSTTVELFTQNPLSKQEAVYAFDRVFELRGVKMVPVGSDKIKAVPIAQQ